jgi:hypothetical protein
MYRLARFFILVFLVIALRQYLILKSDLGILVIAENKASYVYFSPKRDRMYKLDIPLALKPAQLSDYRKWLFYTFGLRAEKVLYNQLDCAHLWRCVESVGLVDGIRLYRFVSRHVYIRLSDIYSISSELIARDLSQAEVLEQGLGLSLLNSTKISGLGLRMARILERQGLTVSYVGNGEQAEIGCKVSGSQGFLHYMAKLPLEDCEFYPIKSGQNSIEVGGKASVVIQYLLYGRSFKMGEY